MAMSGGVDSAVAALLLKENYDITGVTLRLWSEDTPLPDSTECAPDRNVTDARAVAELLDFEHISLSLGESFRRCVVDRFISDYRRGATPNPCVECNRHIKFGKLFELADEMNIPYLATGHYARIVRAEDGGYLLKQAADRAKDQSYFLWSIKKERLPFILFPLGEMTKAEIRAIAAEHGLPVASRSDSQGICFIPDGDYASFIQKYDGQGFREGNFVDLNGNILGRHQGIEKYTVGQRKGLGIALGVPMFVGKKDVADNSVTICSDSELYSDKLTARSVNILTENTLETPTQLSAKIRYRHTPAAATVQRIGDDRISVVFDMPQRAIASGQSVVLYDGDTVVGGGIIE